MTEIIKASALPVILSGIFVESRPNARQRQKLKPQPRSRRLQQHKRLNYSRN